MKWVYVLQCYDGYLYIGETSRLYRRMWEHLSGKGGVNTGIHTPERIVVLYSVNRLGKFFEYTKKITNTDYNLNYNIYFDRGGIIENFNEYECEYEYDSKWVENNITEKIMIDNKVDWNKIKGGKYTRDDVKYKFPKNQVVEELPNCNCGFPCDVKQNEDKKYLYFRCAKKNIWDGMRENFDTEDNPCKFFMKYTKDNDFKVEYDKRKKTIELLTNKSFWLQNVIGGMYSHCIGGCGKIYDPNYTIRYSRKAINLCFDCFVEKNEELKTRYKSVQKLKRLLK